MAEKRVSESMQKAQTSSIETDKSIATIEHNNAAGTDHPESLRLQRGKEQDFVQDEALEMVLDAIKD